MMANFAQGFRFRLTTLVLALALCGQLQAGDLSRDTTRQTPGATCVSGTLPGNVMNLRHLPVIGDQIIGICGSFAPIYYLKTYADAQLKNLNERPDPAVDPENVASPAWGELAFLHGFSGESSMGASMEQIIEQIAIHGMLSWKELPYEGLSGKTLPTVQQQKMALHNKCAGVRKLTGLNSKAGLINLKHYLHDGHIAIVTLAKTHQNFHRLNVGVSNGVYYRTEPCTGNTPGHALTVVGYDDTIAYVDDRDNTTKQGAFLVANSWGQNWGISPQNGVERGFIWIAYDFFLKGGMLNEGCGLVTRTTPNKPALTATVRLHNLRSSWDVPMYDYAIPLYHRLKITVNDQPAPLRIPCAGNHNLRGNSPDGDLEFVLDLTGYAHETFPKLALTCDTTTDEPLFQVVYVQFEKDGMTYNLPGPTPLGVIGKTNPTLELAPMTVTGAGLNNLHPRTGTAVQGDFNQDGLADVVLVTKTAPTAGATEYDSREIMILLIARGDGTFNPPQTIADENTLRLLDRNEHASQLITADLDNDGDLDLLVPAANAQIRILRNDGNGSFILDPTPLPSDAGYGLAAADFNRDGRIDLAVANAQGIQLLVNTAEGWHPFTLTDQLTEVTLAWGDFNGDHLPDLAAYRGDTTDGNPSFKLFFNQGPNGNTWQFVPDLRADDHAYCPDNPPHAPFAADLNNDGNDELAFFSWQGHVRIFKLNTTTGRSLTELPQTEQPKPLHGGTATAADLDGDGLRELVVSGRTRKNHMPYGEYTQPTSDHSPHHVFLYNCNDDGPARRLPLSLPGASGHFGQIAMMTAGNFDENNAPDLLLAGCCGGASEGTQTQDGPLSDSVKAFLLKNQFPQNWFGQINRNQPPSMPGDLKAQHLGNGYVKFTWSCQDDTTPEAGLRFALRIGKSKGGNELHSGRISVTANAMTVRSGVVLALPQGPIHWSVQAIDAGLATSQWAPEQTTNVASSAPPVQAVDLLPANPPSVSITLDQSNLPAGCTVKLYTPEDLSDAPAQVPAGTPLLATARCWDAPNWSFSHWTGPVQDPLSASTQVIPVRDHTVIKAHFIHLSQSQPKAFRYNSVLDNRFVWGHDAPHFRGKAWCAGNDGLPDVAAIPEQADFLSENSQGLFYSRQTYNPNKEDWERKWYYLSGEIAENIPYITQTTSTIRHYDSLLDREIILYDTAQEDSAYAPNIQTLTLVHDQDSITLSTPSKPFHKFALGTRTVLLLDKAGRLYGQGANENGELGNGTFVGSVTFVPVMNQRRFLDVALGKGCASGAVAIDVNGKLWQWGAGNPMPQSLDLPQKAIAVQAGDGFFLALTEDNRLYAWGKNNRGQMGNGSTCKQDTPKPVPYLANITGLAVGHNHVIAVTENGDVYAWGGNELGQATGLPGQDILTPLKLNTGSGNAQLTLTDANATAVGAGTTNLPPGNHLARTERPLTLRATDGERYLFDHWKGTGIANPYASETTVTIQEDSTVRPCWKLKDGQQAVLRLSLKTEDGSTPWEWPEGPLAINTRPVKTAPGTITPAINQEHALNAGTQITLNAMPARQYVFVGWFDLADNFKISDQSTCSLTVNMDMNIEARFKLRPFKTAVDGYWNEETKQYSGYVLNEDGTVYLRHDFGSGKFTELNSLQYLGNVRIIKVLTIMNGWGSPSHIALGNDGRIYTWGADSDYFGRPSEYHYDDFPAPVRMPGNDSLPLTGAQLIAANSQTVLTKCTDGALFAWGFPHDWITDAKTFSPRPVIVTAPASFTTDKIIDMQGLGENSFLFLLNDGTVWSWGNEITGTGQPHPSITRIPNLQNIVQIQTTAHMALALRDDGTVWTWGGDQRWGQSESWDGSIYYYDYLGQLGLGKGVERQDTPCQIPGLKNITRIVCYGDACEAQKQDGTILQWGELTFQTEINGEFHRQQFFVPTAIEQPSQFLLPTSPPHHTLVIQTEQRTHYLLDRPVGSWTFMTGDTVFLNARSDETFDFQSWKLDGQTQLEPKLLLTMNQNHTACASFTTHLRPLLSLENVQAKPETVAAVPLYLKQAVSGYEALDVTINFPEGLTFYGIRRAGTQLSTDARISYWPLPEQTAGSATPSVRLTLRQAENSLRASDNLPLAYLLFTIPLEAQSEYKVSLTASPVAPILSRETGAYTDSGETCQAKITVQNEGYHSFATGWMTFTPRYELPDPSLEAWCLHLEMQGIILTPVAWQWNPANCSWTAASQMHPNQTYLVFVRTPGILKPDDSNPILPLSITLHRGWNLIATPKAVKAPHATCIFLQKPHFHQIHEDSLLHPGHTYWMYRQEREPCTLK